MLNKKFEVFLSLLKSLTNPSLFSLSEKDRLASDPQLLDFFRKKSIDSLYYFLLNEQHPLQTIYNEIWQIQRYHCIEFMKLARENKLHSSVFKGTYFFERYFDSKAVGIMNDVDVLIPSAECYSVKQVLYTLGYSQAIFDSKAERLVPFSKEAITKFENNGYSLAPFSLLVDLPEKISKDISRWFLKLSHPLHLMQGKLKLLISFDIHHSVSRDIGHSTLKFLPNENLFGSSMLSQTDQLWFTLSRFYTEVALRGKTSLRDFAYLMKIMHDPAIDWERLVFLTKRYGLHSAVYYYLYFLNHLSVAKPVPNFIFQELLPTKGPLSRNYGWQLCKLFDLLDPYPY